MTKIYRQSIFAITTLCLLTILSCGKDNPQVSQPQTEGEQTDSFKPHRIELKLYEAHLHGSNLHYTAGPSNLKYLGREQTLSLQLDPKTSSYKIEESNKNPKRFVVQKGTYYHSDNDSTPAPVYGLLINYLDEQGKNINSRIGSNGAYASYQHFFSVEGVKPTFDGMAESSDSSQDIIKYIYKDRDPWDKSHREGSKSISKDNPLGIKGYFIFNKARKTLDLRVQLWSAPNGVKTAGGVSSYNAPKEEMRRRGKKVFEFIIPVTIYRTRRDYPFCER